MNIIISRRSFLAGAAAFSFAGCVDLRSRFTGGRPNLKFGVLSDIHITDWAWAEVFPDGRGADGAKVEKLFVTGNHDFEGLKYRDKFMDKAFAVHGIPY